MYSAWVGFIIVVLLMVMLISLESSMNKQDQKIKQLNASLIRCTEIAKVLIDVNKAYLSTGTGCYQQAMINDPTAFARMEELAK